MIQKPAHRCSYCQCFQCGRDFGKGQVIASKDEGRYEKGKWIPDRRLLGDEAGRGLPNGTIGMLKVKVVRIQN